MTYFRRSQFIRSVMLPFTLIVWLSGCSKRITVLFPAPYETIALEKPGEVTVTIKGGRQIHVRRPWVEADSLRGIVYDARNRTYTDTVSFAVADVASVEQEKTETPTAGKVAAVVLGAASLVALVVLFKGLAEWNESGFGRN